MGDVLSEEFENLLSASIAFDRSNANGLSPNPYTSRKSKHARPIKPCLSALFCLF